MSNVKNLQKYVDTGEIEVFIVGGYVRDRLMGKPGTDHDFVVVGATPQLMIDAGFKQVGADFPVFLADNGDEYALARIERKTGKGYHGFESRFDKSITLQDDLLRRDLTINAMARRVLSWNEEGHAKLDDYVIDLFGGKNDLKSETLRHVSEAFAEDPVRTLRTARFAARYNFDVAPETMDLMKRMGDRGEYDHLVKERVWAEIEKATTHILTRKFFEVLDQTGYLNTIIPHFRYDNFVQRMRDMDPTQLLRVWTAPLPVKVAFIWGPVSGQSLEAIKAPSDVIKFVTRLTDIPVDVKRPEEVLQLFRRLDVFRNHNMREWASIAFSITNEHLLHMMEAALEITYSSLPESETDGIVGKAISELVDKHRLLTLQSYIQHNM